MNKKVVKVPQGNKPQQLTAEQRMAAISRGFTQQFQNIAQGALFNLLNNPSSFSTAIAEPDKIVDAALGVAASFMEKAGAAVDASFDKVMNKAQENSSEVEKAAE